MGEIAAGGEAPFRSVAIVGLGLIGGSIAMGLRKRWPAMTVLGVDRPEIIAEAVRLDAITDGRGRAEDLEADELIVLASPVPSIIELVAGLGRNRCRALVTDVGSTKRHIMTAARAASVRLVGGHPIAGAARAGLAHARPDLFRDREWLLVQDGGTEEDVRSLEDLVRGLGAAPRRISADAHDRLMAYVSHLPQILASALMTTAGDAVGREGLAAAGPGFADMTRLASSPAEIWCGILASNGDHIAEALRAFVSALPLGADGLAETSRIEALFQGANDWAKRT
jgi:prephenate dehydrogenase